MTREYFEVIVLGTLAGVIVGFLLGVITMSPKLLEEIAKLLCN